MRITWLVVQKFRNLKPVDVPVSGPATDNLGENKDAKSSQITALRLCLAVATPARLRNFAQPDIQVDVLQDRLVQALVGVVPHLFRFLSRRRCRPFASYAPNHACPSHGYESRRDHAQCISSRWLGAG